MPDSDDEKLPELRNGEIVLCKKAGRQFEILKKLGAGGFGAVYLVKDADKPTQELKYAMKCEGKATADNDLVAVLKMEVSVLKKVSNLTEERFRKHFCKIIAKGNMPKFNFIVMTLVGKSLSDLRKEQRGGRFCLATALRASRQSLEGIEGLHKVGYIHRDIKPGNFATGTSDSNELRLVYMLDFGMCRLHLPDGDGAVPRVPRSAAEFRGTVRYAPLNCHRCRDLARKDDVEIWFYMMVEMITGRLPWYNMNDKTMVGNKKEECRTREGMKRFLQNCPREFRRMLVYVDELKYWEAPDYKWLDEMTMRPLSTNTEFNEEWTYDWEPGHTCQKIDLGLGLPPGRHLGQHERVFAPHAATPHAQSQKDEHQEQRISTALND